MRRYLPVHAAIVAAIITHTNRAQAEVTFEWVIIANAGNNEDPLNSGTIPGIGSVAGGYRIAKHEVTNSQYAEFLNSVDAAGTNPNAIYNIGMNGNRGGISFNAGAPNGNKYTVKPNMGNKPVNFISYFAAMRFVNWLANGQTSGGTETGVYTISNGVSEIRAANAPFFIPSENEWYKAAYHQPSSDGGDADNYWLYPTRSNAIPTVATCNSTGDITNPGTNVANYDNGADWNRLNGHVTTVGSAGAGSDSYSGTSDQGGNVYEWTEAVMLGSNRSLRGGAMANPELDLRSSARIPNLPASTDFRFGFRVGSSLVQGGIPTVSQWGMVAMGLLTLTAGTVLVRRRRVNLEQ